MHPTDEIILQIYGEIGDSRIKKKPPQIKIVTAFLRLFFKKSASIAYCYRCIS